MSLPECPYRGVCDWDIPKADDVPAMLCGATAINSLDELLCSMGSPGALNCAKLCMLELCPEGWR